MRRLSLFWSSLRILLLVAPLLPVACSSDDLETGDPSNGAQSGKGGATSAGSGSAQAGSKASGGSSGSAGKGGSAGAAGSGLTAGSGGSVTAGTGGTTGGGATGGSTTAGVGGGDGGTAGSLPPGGSSGSAGTVTDPCATVTCGEGQTCVDGACQCMTGTLCDGACFDTQNDPMRCGTCETTCASDGACVDGSCVTPMCTPDTEMRSGRITYYQLATPMVGCHWPTSTLPQHYGAMNEFDWNGAGVCGACVEITNTQNNSKITVQIVDQCPRQGNEQWCYEGSHHIDLNQAAYSALGANNNPSVNWKYVPCSPMGNIKYYFDEGSQQYYLAVSPLNYKNPLAKVEVKKGGVFTALTRSTWNMFELTMGAGTGELTFRLTDIYNHVVIDTVTLSPGQTVDGSAQFAACP
jgi:expansin (peptidoglycan-binding protein)